MSTRSLSFSGAGTDYLTVPDANSLDLTSPFTIAFWIKPVTVNASGAEIMEKGNIGSAGAYLVELSGTRKVVFTIPTVVNVGSAGTALPLNTWSHVCITKSGSNYVFYVNGVSDQTPTNASTVSANAATLIIGRRSFTTTLALNGLLDEIVLIAGTALTGGQVSTLYSTHVSPVTPTAEWLIEEGTGTTTADTSGNSNTATLVGSPTWSTDVPVTATINNAGAFAAFF